MKPDFNDKGECLLWDKGSPIGYVAVDTVDGHRVPASMKPTIVAMQQAAAKDGVELTLAAGLRTFGEQVQLRIKNAIDKVKAHDEHFLLTAPSSEFSPVTGKPGWSNHHDGQAYDFNVTGKSDVYAWLIKHAIQFGFIRTVKTERWHWEHRPGQPMFAVVPKEDPTWDGLINNEHDHQPTRD